MEKIRNVFVSHHHKDDASVDGIARILSGKSYKIRNSSIRVKPENQERVNKKKVSDAVIRRLLRMKMRWASRVIVVIGKETHQREWVGWEIEAAHRLGRPIVGVYEHGLKEKVPLPKKLEDYSTAIVGWNSDAIIRAVEGDSVFQSPDGTPAPNHLGDHSVC